MLGGCCASEGREVAERETEMAREGCWGLAGGKIGKQADDWAAQDGGGGEKKNEKEEERNERRARQRLQMGWDWQRERDGSLERRRESAAGRLLTAPLLGEGLLMTAYSFMISLPDSRQVCWLRRCSCIITFWPCHCSASMRPRR